MQFTIRETHKLQLAFQVAGALALGVFFGIIGPFGTYADLSPANRYAYWIGLVLVGYVSILVSAHAAHLFWPRMAHWPRVALVTLASTVPTTLAVAWVESVLRLGHPVPLSVMPSVYGSVAIIQLLTVLVLTRFQSNWRVSSGCKLIHRSD